MNRITAIEIGNSQEVPVEQLLMKLATVEEVVKGLNNYIENPDATPPDDWAVAGAFHNLTEVKHALKCACWGHREAGNH